MTYDSMNNNNIALAIKTLIIYLILIIILMFNVYMQDKRAYADEVAKASKEKTDLITQKHKCIIPLSS